MTIEAGSRAPLLTLQSTRGDVVIPDPGGRPVVLMFFQEAGTPTCTVQVSSLGAEAELLAEANVAAICVSTDPIDRLLQFTASLGDHAPVLASDPDAAAARAYGVYDELGGRAQRAAFVIDGVGDVRLALPWYSPSNSAQFASIFEALGRGDDG